MESLHIPVKFQFNFTKYVKVLKNDNPFFKNKIYFPLLLNDS